MLRKSPLALTALGLLVLLGTASIWVRREARFGGSVAPSVMGDGADLLGERAEMRGVELEGDSPRAQSESRIPESRTTWSAQVIASGDRRPLSDVPVRVKLLSPDEVPQDLVLISDDDGRVGPIGVAFERHPGAEVSVDPGPRWAACFTTVLFAAGEANHDVIELAAPATLTVRVVDHPSRAPLVGADVTVRDASDVLVHVASDTQGLARIAWNAPGGPFSVGAAAEGFSAMFCAELARPLSSDLEVELLLAPECVLNVRVQDEAGHAITGLDADAVTADPIRGSLPAVRSANGVRLVPAHWDSPLEESGAYVFPSVPCGTLLAARAVLPDGRAGLEFVRVPARPGVAEATITIANVAGTEVWTFDDRGGPLGGVAIGAEREELGSTDESGRLTLALQDLTPRELWAYKEGYALEWQTWAPGLDNVIYHLMPDRPTSGTVVDSSGRPQRWVRITPLLGAREEPYDARRRRGELATSSGRKNANRTDAAGAFELHGLGDGWVDLHVRPPKQGSFEVKDVRVGMEGLVITIPDESTLGVEQGVAWSIVVRDESTGEPLEGATVIAFYAADPAPRSPRESRMGTTGADGALRLTSAQAGSHWITATADGYVPFSGPITEYPVGEHALQIRLSPSADLVISLVDQAGTGRQGYWIRGVGPDGLVTFNQAHESGGRSSSSEIITDVQGCARANRMLPGRIVLEVRDGPGGKNDPLIREEVDLIAGERTEVELRLP